MVVTSLNRRFQRSRPICAPRPSRRGHGESRPAVRCCRLNRNAAAVLDKSRFWDGRPSGRNFGPKTGQIRTMPKAAPLRKRLFRIARVLVGAIVLVAAVPAAVLAFPQPLFAYHVERGHLQLW